MSRPLFDVGTWGSSTIKDASAQSSNLSASNHRQRPTGWFFVPSFVTTVAILFLSFLRSCLVRLQIRLTEYRI